jgi:hypothetical protein
MPVLKRGYELLAEAFIREKRIDDAFTATLKVSEGKAKQYLLREIRNSSVKQGNLNLYRQASEMAGLNGNDKSDIATMLLANLDKNNIEALAELFNLLPDNPTKEHLKTTAIIELAYKGLTIACERIAKVCNIELSKDQARIAKVNAIREGWITDAERAAEMAGEELTKEDYTVMFIANKDKGLLFEAQEAVKRAGIELDEPALVAILLAGVRQNRGSVWDVAEMF